MEIRIVAESFTDLLLKLLDIQAEVNNKIKRALKRETGDEEEAAKIMDECKLASVVTEKKTKDSVEIIADIVPPRTPSKLKQSNSASATPSKTSESVKKSKKESKEAPSSPSQPSSRSSSAASTPKSSRKAAKKEEIKEEEGIVELDEDF